MRAVTQSDSDESPGRIAYTIQKHIGSPQFHKNLSTCLHTRNTLLAGTENERRTLSYWKLVLAVTALAGATASRENNRRSATWSTGRQANGDVRRLALASLGGGAAGLVNGDGDDLQDRRPTRRRQ